MMPSFCKRVVQALETLSKSKFEVCSKNKIESRPQSVFTLQEFFFVAMKKRIALLFFMNYKIYSTAYVALSKVLVTINRKYHDD